MNIAEWPRAKTMPKRAAEMLGADLTSGKQLPGNSRPLQLHRPRATVRSAPSQAAPAIPKLTAEENARFLHLVASCAQITTHYELFLLVQGELQFFLPQDILIAAWGEFRAKDPQVDVISSLPGMRTDRICDKIVPLAKRLHGIWMDGGTQPYQLNKTIEELQARTNDACPPPCAFPGMELTLVHGIRNKRDGSDSLYIALRRRQSANDGSEARLRFLADSVIHQIDIAYRKVAALSPSAGQSGESVSSGQLSVREAEITSWICEGKTNAQIAKILGISVNTVKNHVHRIFDKLGANNRTQAVVRYANMPGGSESRLSVLGA